MEDSTLVPLRFYAKRLKLYGAFGKFFFQRRALHHIIDNLLRVAGMKVFQVMRSESGNLEIPESPVTEEERLRAEMSRTVLHFLSICQRFTIWEGTEMWRPLPEMREQLQSCRAKFEEHDLSTDEMILLARTTWDRLANLSNMHEELCREWFLSSFFSQLTT